MFVTSLKIVPEVDFVMFGDTTMVHETNEIESAKNLSRNKFRKLIVDSLSIRLRAGVSYTDTHAEMFEVIVF